MDSDSSGNQKGSLKNRLNVLNILMRISRKKKLRLNFSNINADRIIVTNKMYLKFYTPVKLIVDDKINNTVLYNKIKEKDIKLSKGRTINDVEFNLIKNKRKKGIGLENIKEEIKEKYELEEISDNLIKDYELIKNDLIFEEYLSDEIKEEFIIDRISVKEEMDLIYSYKDTILIKDIDYDLNDYLKNDEKLKKIIKKYEIEIENLERNINKFGVINNSETKITNLSVLFKNMFGLGIGILTLPFSYPVTLTLGTSLIAKSINNIEKNVKFENKETKTIKYKVEVKDTYFNGTRDLNYTNENLTTKMNSEESLDVKEYNGNYFMDVKKAAVYHDPLVKSFLTYYCISK